MGTIHSIVATLRKICLHPYLFEYPLTDNNEYLVDEQLIRKSGKFAVLDRLLSGLLERKHKVKKQCLKELSLFHRHHNFKNN